MMSKLDQENVNTREVDGEREWKYQWIGEKKKGEQVSRKDTKKNGSQGAGVWDLDILQM